MLKEQCLLYPRALSLALRKAGRGDNSYLISHLMSVQVERASQLCTPLVNHLRGTWLQNFAQTFTAPFSILRMHIHIKHHAVKGLARSSHLATHCQDCECTYEFGVMLVFVRRMDKMIWETRCIIKTKKRGRAYISQPSVVLIKENYLDFRDNSLIAHRVSVSDSF